MTYHSGICCPCSGFSVLVQIRYGVFLLLLFFKWLKGSKPHINIIVKLQLKLQLSYNRYNYSLNGDVQTSYCSFFFSSPCNNCGIDIRTVTLNNIYNRLCIFFCHKDHFNFNYYIATVQIQ